MTLRRANNNGDGKPPWAKCSPCMEFRYYESAEGYETFEGRRAGQDPPERQLEELLQTMSGMVFDDGQEIEATLIVQRRPRTKMRWPLNT